MPVDGPLDFLYTMQGEASMRAERASRQALALRAEADDYDREAFRHSSQVQWLQQAIDAMNTMPEDADET
jgi:hypothetical protein